MRSNGKYRILLVMATISLSFSACFAASTDTLINTLYDTTTKDPVQLKTLISRYCSTVLSSDAFLQDSAVYNAKYSSFVYLLCRNISSASDSNLSDAYFSRKSFKELGFSDIDEDGRDLCTPVSMSNDCDLAQHISDLFNSIMNDYLNIKQSTIYGSLIPFGSDDDLSTAVNAYFSGYFGIAICGNEKHPYDKTCRLAKSYARNARNILSEVSVLSGTALLSLPTQTSSCASLTLDTDLFYCGLKDDAQNGLSLSSFTDLVYNELFYYRLFMGYYLTMLQKYPSLLQRNTYITSYSSVYQDFNNQYTRSKSALSLSLRMMRDMYMAFPIHVGFSLYEEDLDGFGKLVAKIAPPIYTLYDKLRNVQKPQ